MTNFNSAKPTDKIPPNETQTIQLEKFRVGLNGAIGKEMLGSEIDLRGAKMSGDEAVIDAFAFWGGVEIQVPRDWTIEDQVTPVLGSFEDKTEPAGTGGKRLIVRGTAVMGGIEVTN